MKNYTFYSNSLPRFKIILIFSVFYMLIFLTACPKLPKANIRITLNRTPILMKWNGNAGLWYMTNSVTITETEGVGVKAEYIKLEIFYDADIDPSLLETHLVEITGGRVDAFKSVKYDIEVGTKYKYYNNARFSIIGTDDYGYDIKASVEANLDYVD